MIGGLAVFIFFLLPIGVFLYGFWMQRLRGRRSRVKLGDGVMDDAMVAVRYKGKLIPMRRIEYLEYWCHMNREEKREMAIRIEKAIEKGKVRGVKTSQEVFEEVYEDEPGKFNSKYFQDKR